MTEPLSAPEEEYDPSTMAISSLTNRRVPWYRRPWFLITAVVVVVAAISIVTDLPHPISVSQDIAAQNAVLAQMRSDVQECAYGVRESFSLFARYDAGSLSPSELATTKTYVAEDEVPCSFAGQPVYDLTQNIEITLTAAGKHVDAAHTALDHWITGTALKAIEDIRQLLDDPTAPGVRANLAYQARELDQERATVLADIGQADRILGATLITPQLPVVPEVSAH